MINETLNFDIVYGFVLFQTKFSKALKQLQLEAS